MMKSRKTLAMGLLTGLAACTALMAAPAIPAFAADAAWNSHPTNDGKKQGGVDYTTAEKQAWAHQDLKDGDNKEIANYPYNGLTITKIVKASQAIDTQGDTFDFEFTPVTTKPADEALTPSKTASGQDIIIPKVTITMDAMGESDTQTKVVTVTMPDVSQFPHAGCYGFICKETTHSVKETTGWEFSQAEYQLRVYVKNNSTQTGLEYDYITSTCVKQDDGSSDDHKYPIVFENTCLPTANLNFIKTVKGDYADLTTPFQFKIDLEIPETYNQSLVTNYTVAGGAAKNLVFANGKGSVTESLKNGESIIFNNLPVGTHYSAVELTRKDAAGVVYHDAWKYTFSPAAGQRADKGFSEKVNQTVGKTPYGDGQIADYTLTKDELMNNTKAPDTRTMVGGGANNRVDVTNTAEDIPATGILVMSLPYVLLIGGPIVCGLAYVAVRRKTTR